MLTATSNALLGPRPAVRTLGRGDTGAQFRETSPRPASSLAAPRSRRGVSVRASSSSTEALPTSFERLIRQCQTATAAALSDGATLLEIEFPPAGLNAVAGDAEGANEMTYNMNHVKKYVSMFQRSGQSPNVRVFFPDISELKVAKYGKAKDPNAGSWDIDPVFQDGDFKLDYLTKPTGLGDMGIEVFKVKVEERTKPEDELFIAAYPSFNVNEILAIEELYVNEARDTGRPIVVFNGELDRMRGGYYPALFYPKISKCSKNFIPLFTPVFYLHNFKGSSNASLFRCYPGPWQVIVKDPYDSSKTTVVWESEERPTLKYVALEILPNLR